MLHNLARPRLIRGEQQVAVRPIPWSKDKFIQVGEDIPENVNFHLLLFWYRTNKIAAKYHPWSARMIELRTGKKPNWRKKYGH